MTDSPNIELVRSLFMAWEQGDYASSEWAHPQIEWVMPDGISPGTWTGIAGMREGWRSVLDAYEGYRGEAEDYLELDDERVLVLTHVEGRGKTSGMDIGELGGSRGALLVHIRDGKVTRLVVYWNRYRAFADLGLTPEGDP